MFRLKFSLGPICFVMLSCLWRWSCMLMNIRQVYWYWTNSRKKMSWLISQHLQITFTLRGQKAVRISFLYLHTTLLTDSEVITGKSQTEDGRSVNASRPRSERFPCKDRTDEKNKLSIKWPFHYGPEPAINENQQLVSGKKTLEGASSQPTYATDINTRSNWSLGECVRYLC